MHLLSYLILRLICSVLILLPLGFSYFLARLIGNFTYNVVHYRRQIVMENLHIAFGSELKEAELEKIAAESYRQIAMSFIELMIGPKLQKQIHQILKPGDFQLIQRLLQQGKGLIAISAHLGSWELQGAAAATAMREPLTVAAVQQSIPCISMMDPIVIFPRKPCSGREDSMKTNLTCPLPSRPSTVAPRRSR